ncbi:MAG: RNA polymerase sigma-70 factor [Paludibacteraceae bacterium]|nr:RNA polymerase sigma-70 factor [Paludibacteraceae bacterium]
MAIKPLHENLLTTQAFEQLFFEYQPRLVRFAVKYLEEEAAEDIVQNAFLKLWEKKDEIALDNVQALLFQIVRNECLNELKHRAMTSTESLDGLMEVEGSEQLYWQDFAPDADAVLIGDELQQQIDEALTHVSEKSRVIFRMSRQQEMKPKEIAEELGITRQAVEKHINAALDALRTYLPKKLLPLVAFWQVILLYE